MISVIIPTLDAAASLPACLAALVPAVVDGVVAEVIVVDGGSSDQTRQIADDAGCRLVEGTKSGRGPQLRAGAAVARKPWLLFLHADTVLEAGWHDEVAALMGRVERGDTTPCAAAFRFALDDDALAARLIAIGVGLRCRLFKLPYGDQGLLLPRGLYEACGGYPALPLMEDVALVQAVPRRQRVLLRARAVTSAERYRRDGYVHRVLRNWSCLAMYQVGISPETISRFYRRR